MKDLMLEIVRGLTELSIQELEELKIEWINKIREKGVSEHVLNLCSATVDLVIEEKESEVY